MNKLPRPLLACLRPLNHSFFRKLILGLLFFCMGRWADAQWITQSIQLQPGWNSVFVEVAPEPRNPAQLFQGIPVESVWAWNERFSTTQFLEDPDTLVPENPKWLHWYPLDNPASVGNNLFIVRGGSPLLIKLSGDTPVVWNVTGLAHFDAVDWIPNSFNLTGFYIDPAIPPTFQAFFAPSPAHNNFPKYRLNSAGDWELITDPDSRAINPGEAYWIFCNGSSRYSGPLLADSSLGFELEFERVLTQIPVRVRNASAASRNLVLKLLGSGNPPSASFPLLAGSVPLSYSDVAFPGGVGQYLNFPAELSLTLASQQSAQIEFQVRRRDMPPFGVPPGTPYLYQSILEITDGAGSRIRFPVSAEDSLGNGLASVAGAPGRVSQGTIKRLGVQAGPGVVVNPRAGLWVGTVTLNAVSQPANVADSTVVRPAGGELTFRIIVHVNAQGVAQLLQQVYLLFEEGTLKDDPNDNSIPPSQIVDQPGRFVLVTDEALIANYQGSLVRDGDAVGRRYSSTAFGFDQPQTMNTIGAFGNPGSKSTVTVTLPYDDPLNPFFHKFHPDHDNLDRRFENDLGAGFESFTIARSIELSMTASVPDGLPLVGLGDRLLVGNYRESITGLHKQTINVQGTFRLTRVSNVDALNQ
jgi:hypothetical protein